MGRKGTYVLPSQLLLQAFMEICTYAKVKVNSCVVVEVVVVPQKKQRKKKGLFIMLSTTKTCYLLCAFGWDRMMDAVMGPPVSA